MNDEGITNTYSDIETTPKVNEITEKPLKAEKKKFSRVDINVLKSKLQETENKQFRKNLSILSILIFLLAILGVYLSL